MTRVNTPPNNPQPAPQAQPTTTPTTSPQLTQTQAQTQANALNVLQQNNPSTPTTNPSTPTTNPSTPTTNPSTPTTTTTPSTPTTTTTPSTPTTTTTPSTPTTTTTPSTPTTTTTPSTPTSEDDEEKKGIIKYAPTLPELTEFGKAVQFGVKEAYNSIGGRVANGTVAPIFGFTKSFGKIFTDLFSFKKIKKQPKSYSANFKRIPLTLGKSIYSLLTSPITISAGLYKGIHGLIEVFDKKILQNTPFVCYLSKYALMPGSNFINNSLSGIDGFIFENHLKLDELDKKLVRDQKSRNN